MHSAINVLPMEIIVLAASLLFCAPLVVFECGGSLPKERTTINCDLRVVIAGFTWVSGDIAL